MNAYQTVAMRELLDAADLFAQKGNAKAAIACQIAKTKVDVEKIIQTYGTNNRLQNAMRYMYD
jgi:hypothetical protein